MKSIILSFIVVFFVVENSICQNEIAQLDNKEETEEVILNWELSFKKALKKSKKEKKPILIYFTGSDWCTPCKILDEKLFHTEKFKAIADKDLILYKADSPRNKDLVDVETRKVNNKLSKKYKQKSFPTILMVNSRGKVLKTKKGIYMTEYYYPFIQSVIENY